MSRVNHRSVIRYLEHMLKTPLSAWWAVATGVVGIISFAVLSPTVSISRVVCTPAVRQIGLGQLDRGSGC
jgi:hypothetical protein